MEWGILMKLFTTGLRLYMFKIYFQMQCYYLFSWFSHVQYDHIDRVRIKSLPGGSDGKESTCNAEDMGEEDTLEKE